MWLDTFKNFINHIDSKLPFPLFSHPLSQKIFRFLSGGGLIWLLRAGLTTILAEYAGVDPVIAYRYGLAASFVIYFFMNIYFVFLVHDHILWRLSKYTLTSLTFLSTDGLLMQWFHQSFDIPYLAALSASTLILLVVKFIVYNTLVFNSSNSSPSKP